MHSCRWKWIIIYYDTLTNDLKAFIFAILVCKVICFSKEKRENNYQTEIG
jgi:hypothetical protein